MFNKDLKAEITALKSQITSLKSQIPSRTENLDLLQYVYTDKFGIKYYEFKSMEYLVRSRAKIFFMVLNNADLAIATEDIQNYVNAQDTLINQILVAKTQGLDLKNLHLQTITNSAVLLERLILSADYNCMLQIAKCLFLLENEPMFASESEFEKFGKIKENYWNKDNDALGFFLQKAIRHVGLFKDISESDLQDLAKYLMNQSQAFLQK